MRKKVSSEKVTWIDIMTPTENDLSFLKENFDFHPFILKSILPPIHHPRFENYKDYLFLVLHYPFFDEKTKETKSREIDIIVTKNTLITIRYNNIAPLQSFFTKLILYEKERKEFTDEGVGEVLYRLLYELLRNSFPKLDHISEKIDSIEKEIFKEQRQKEVIEEISTLKYDLINFKRIIQPQLPVFEKLKEESKNFFGEHFEPYFNELVNCFLTIKEVLETHHRTLNELEETNANLLSIKTNEIIKILTIFWVILSPLTLLATIYGMNTSYLPFTDIKYYDFWIIIGIMAVLSIIILVFLKKKKWI
jgi:magnesium transporter